MQFSFLSSKFQCLNVKTNHHKLLIGMLMDLRFLDVECVFVSV